MLSWVEHGKSFITLGLEYLSPNICTRRRFRSACTITQSDQNLHCAKLWWPTVHSFFVQTRKTLIRLCGCAGWSESSTGAYVWRHIFWHQGYKTFSMLNSAQLVNIHNHNFHTSISFHQRLDLSLPLAHMSEKYVFFHNAVRFLCLWYVFHVCGMFFHVCGMFFMFVVCFFYVCGMFFSCLWYVFRVLFFHIATLFFCRSLQCSRITIHKNLVISYIFRFILNIIIVEPFISRRKPSYRDLVSELAHKHVHVLRIILSQ